MNLIRNILIPALGACILMAGSLRAGFADEGDSNCWQCHGTATTCSKLLNCAGNGPGSKVKCTAQNECTCTDPTGALENDIFGRIAEACPALISSAQAGVSDAAATGTAGPYCDNCAGDTQAHAQACLGCPGKPKPKCTNDGIWHCTCAVAKAAAK